LQQKPFRNHLSPFSKVSRLNCLGEFKLFSKILIRSSEIVIPTQPPDPPVFEGEEMKLTGVDWNVRYSITNYISHILTKTSDKNAET
jgi:hypothetical protein